MKKDERHTYIINKAYELAYAGEGIDWLTIELILRADGLSEARSLLDNNYYRKELNEICNKANSPAEIKNRADFIIWIKEFIEKNISIVKKEQPNINIYIRENKFSISSSKKELAVSKIFNSRKLCGDYYFEESDGHRYKSSNHYQSQKPFDEFAIEDLFHLIKMVS